MFNYKFGANHVNAQGLFGGASYLHAAKSKPRGRILPTAVLLYDSTSGVPARRVDILRTGRKSRGIREYVPAW